MGVFSAVDSWLDRLSGGQIRRAQSGERECMQCRALGTLVFGAAAAHSGVEAIRARSQEAPSHRVRSLPTTTLVRSSKHPVYVRFERVALDSRFFVVRGRSLTC
mmetsp:Transcript_146837/g.469171  ORF Transcript_146837/g.469171 Transcript_146837/m.469171 type:complete len:104 (-) Transcript_146837:103-414(-)